MNVQKGAVRNGAYFPGGSLDDRYSQGLVRLVKIYILFFTDYMYALQSIAPQNNPYTNVHFDKISALISDFSSLNPYYWKTLWSDRYR